MISEKAREQRGYFPKSITKHQVKDTGMVMVLVCLLINYFGQNDRFLLAGVVLLVIDLVYPSFYTPFARVWFGLSHLLGTLMSKALLTILFFLMVTPTGLFRRIVGSDSMQLKKWKQGKSSVFQIRDHIFGPGDIEKPY